MHLRSFTCVVKIFNLVLFLKSYPLIVRWTRFQIFSKPDFVCVYIYNNYQQFKSKQNVDVVKFQSETITHRVFIILRFFFVQFMFRFFFGVEKHFTKWWILGGKPNKIILHSCGSRQEIESVLNQNNKWRNKLLLNFWKK
jgi:hypothetical protein